VTAWNDTLPDLLAALIADADDFDKITGALHGLTDAWSSFTLTWTAASVNPSLGNGSKSAFYLRAGKLVVYTGRISMGSTTTFGTGKWLVDLPVAPVASGSVSTICGAGIVYDADTGGNRKPCTAWYADTSHIEFNSDGGEVAATVPFTWATSDQLRWLFLYEAA